MTVNLDPLRDKVEILRFVKQRKAELKHLEETAREAVEEALGDEDAGTLDGQVAIVWQRYKKRALNQKALKEAHPELVEEFKETSEVRRFEVITDD